MSFTISASAGEPRWCSGRNRASLLSWTVFSDVSRSTSGDSSSGQRAIPASYSASQTGQNISAPYVGPTHGSVYLYFVLCTLHFVLCSAGALNFRIEEQRTKFKVQSTKELRDSLKI